MSDLLVNINSEERRTILTVGADLSMKNLPVYLFLLINPSLDPFTFRLYFRVDRTASKRGDKN